VSSGGRHLKLYGMHGRDAAASLPSPPEHVMPRACVGHSWVGQARNAASSIALQRFWLPLYHLRSRGDDAGGSAQRLSACRGPCRCSTHLQRLLLARGSVHECERNGEMVNVKVYETIGANWLAGVSWLGKTLARVARCLQAVTTGVVQIRSPSCLRMSGLHV
jgi:hypothetical protein